MKAKKLDVHAFSRLPVPLGFNAASNRFREHIRCLSDCTLLEGSFYEYHGIFWYSLQIIPFNREMNSIPFLSIRQCISSFRRELKENGFRFADKSSALNSISVLCKENAPKYPSTHWRF